ncbi:dTDP-4-dehydrorhamnose reductase [Paenibacillus aquistagni]|uniref:dTDP-4-dehydrorhamnose reductase n=1 Tax=Paenibacillus aquistagni TaxID=1852522 RepID=A0A1X7K998_9BACL|nr:dTDP-4-dehydrorhamnose reductase [Paenibacillus aquistagni]SMG37406.1 dTDP-4-dehydrorhamnose reductase [Paenibacillus aquistagni]
MSRSLVVAVTGANGQLGRDVLHALKLRGITGIGLTRTEMDIVDQAQVMHTLVPLKPDVIIHTAAYTQVDQAESERDLAYQVNAYGARNVACAAAAIDAKLIHISTDYVFDGRANKPYDEFTPVRPVNVYGASKHAGEELVMQCHRKTFLIRTSWVYGHHGHNFVKTMLRLAKSQSELKVVHDQIGCPTYTMDLAERLVDLLFTECYGVYHITNAGSCSWYEFACAIMEEKGLQVKVRSVPTSQFPRPARRPSYSVLEGMALRLQGFAPLRPWREALREMLASTI